MRIEGAGGVGVDGFLGSWRLVPERSRFQQGSPPRSATYVIDRDEGGLRFTMEWPGRDGHTEHMQYTVPWTGDARRELRLDGDGDLVTIVREDGHVVSLARRTLLDGGRMLAIIHTGPRADGGTFENLSMYEKIEGEG